MSNLREDTSEELSKFKDYFDNTFDAEKVEKASDEEKDKIVNSFVDASNNSSIKTDKEFKDQCKSAMTAAGIEDQIEKGNTNNDEALKKFMKSEEELKEGLIFGDDFMNFNDVTTMNMDTDLDDDTEEADVITGYYCNPVECSCGEEVPEEDEEAKYVIDGIRNITDKEIEAKLDDYESKGGDYSNDVIVIEIAESYNMKGRTILAECRGDIPRAICVIAEREKNRRIEMYCDSAELDSKKYLSHKYVNNKLN